ncbi:rod shape-determining protein MreC [Peptococcaceae bacterium]|nr:rod shape-determining protein MreC [Peptococcaceae bacterium]
MVIKMTPLEREQLTLPETVVKIVLAPFQQVATGLSNGIQDSIAFVAALGTLAQENKQFKKELALLKSELERTEEYRVQNRRLKELLQYKQFTVANYQLVTATVIGRNAGNWFATVTVNRGKKDGIARNMPALVPAGLVGRVVAVSSDTAEILLITDPRSGVGAVIQQSRLPGVVEGVASGAGTVRMVHLPKGAPVKPNQAVVTSGLGGIYPPGVRIGRILITEDDPGGLFQIAKLEPFVDFSKLEDLFIVTVVYTPELNLPVEGME